jgi:MerR family transcriptional regulator, light-induced transcriptional regulator
LRTLKTREAAALLNVSPNTLRDWERRFGYPKPPRSPGKHRLYYYAEIIALRNALEQGLSVSSAISIACEPFGADAYAVAGALSAFRADRADAAMEGSLALRSLERSLDEVLLPALNTIRLGKGELSAVWAFGSAWSEDWLLRARRLLPAKTRIRGVLIGDASAPPLDPARPYVLALELCCLRSGIDLLCLPLSAHQHLSEAVTMLDPDAIIIAGSHSSDDEVARWAYKVRSIAGRLPIALYHRPLTHANGRHQSKLLSPSPVAAQDELLDFLGCEIGAHGTPLR